MLAGLSRNRKQKKLIARSPCRRAVLRTWRAALPQTPENHLARRRKVTYALLSVEQSKSNEIAQGACAGAEVCPLSRVPVGATVCIRSLAPEAREKLRALGLAEKQEIKILS